MERIIEIGISIIAWIMLYALFTTLAIIIIITRKNKRKRKYIDWKRDVLTIPLFKREWERNDDDLLNELFSENERLTKENKILKQDLTNRSIVNLILLIFIVFITKLKDFKNKDTN